MTEKKALTNIQSRLKAPKSQYNSFGKYNYRNCEDILEAVKPLLSETETILLLSDEIVMVGERYYVKAMATIIGKNGETIAQVSAFAREADTKKGMDASQITGASSSYARKYALNGLFCIDDTRDADTTNKHGKGNNNKTDQKNKASQDNFLKIMAELQENLDTQTYHSILGDHGFSSADEITNRKDQEKVYIAMKEAEPIDIEKEDLSY